MCLLIAKPAGKDVPEEIMRTAAKRNADGLGIVVRDGPKLSLWKALESDKKIDELVKRVADAKDVDALIHFRLATHGAKTVENVHPFLIHGKSLAMAHNGVIRIPSNQEYSDTRVFAYKVLAKMAPGWWKDPITVEQVERLIHTDRMALLSAKDGIILLNPKQFSTRDEVHYSNAFCFPYTPAERQSTFDGYDDSYWNRGRHYPHGSGSHSQGGGTTTTIVPRRTATVDWRARWQDTSHKWWSLTHYDDDTETEFSHGTREPTALPYITEEQMALSRTMRKILADKQQPTRLYATDAKNICCYSVDSGHTWLRFADSRHADKPVTLPIHLFASSDSDRTFRRLRRKLVEGVGMISFDDGTSWTVDPTAAALQSAQHPKDCNCPVHAAERAEAAEALATAAETKEATSDPNDAATVEAPVAAPAEVKEAATAQTDLEFEQEKRREELALIFGDNENDPVVGYYVYQDATKTSALLFCEECCPEPWKTSRNKAMEVRLDDVQFMFGQSCCACETTFDDVADDIRYALDEDLNEDDEEEALPPDKEDPNAPIGAMDFETAMNDTSVPSPFLAKAIPCLRCNVSTTLMVCNSCRNSMTAREVLKRIVAWCTSPEGIVRRTSDHAAIPFALDRHVSCIECGSVETRYVICLTCRANKSKFEIDTRALRWLATQLAYDAAAGRLLPATTETTTTTETPNDVETPATPETPEGGTSGGGSASDGERPEPAIFAAAGDAGE